MAWYRLRTWMEGGTKDLKRGRWGWQHRKMERASGAARLWLALALVQRWWVRLGSQQEEQRHLREPGMDLPPAHRAHRSRTRPAGLRPARRLSCALRGQLLLLARLFCGQVLTVGTLTRQSWPEQLQPPQKLRGKRSEKTQKQREQHQQCASRARARAHSQARQKKPLRVRGIALPPWPAD